MKYSKTKTDQVKRLRMTDWSSLGVLFRTGMRSFFSSKFGGFIDKREIQKIYPKDSYSERPRDSADGIKWNDYSRVGADTDFYIDYIADTGDGWDSTYGMAQLMARPSLVYKDEDESETNIQSGNVLVFGGDQVYPYASRELYQKRFLRPFKQAFAGRQHPQDMYILPANHDWYDGLTSFSRLFLQQRCLGKLQTRQNRSYFALKLPNNWWLWGVDFYLTTYIDKPQIDYFTEVAQALTKESKVILCTPCPEWVMQEEKKHAYRNIDHFYQRIIKRANAKMPLLISGDLHHFAAYEEQNNDTDKRWMITAGGGGAYLSATHHLPDEIEIIEQRQGSNNQRDFKLIQELIYPSQETSKRLTSDILSFITLQFKILNKFNLSYLFCVGYFLQMLLQLMLSETYPYNILFLGIMMPAGIALAFGIIDSSTNNRCIKITFGCVHFIAHYLLSISFSDVFNSIIESLINGHSIFLTTLLVIAGLLIIALLGFSTSFFMSVYLRCASLYAGINLNEAFSFQGRDDYKSFLRMKINDTGNLTIYLVKVDKICRGRHPDYVVEKVVSL